MNPTQTIDIDTTAAAPILVITDDKELSDIIFTMAGIELAHAKVVAKLKQDVEALKKAYDDATRDDIARNAALLASVEVYAKANRERLFGKKKSVKVLQHQLQFRSSEEIVIDDPDGLCDDFIDATQDNRLDESKRALAARMVRTIREPNKDVIKAAWENFGDWLQARFKIGLKQTETFKIAFKFTPGGNES